MLHESTSLLVRLLRGFSSAKPNFGYGIFCLSSLGFAQIPCIYWQQVWPLWLDVAIQLWIFGILTSSVTVYYYRNFMSDYVIWASSSFSGLVLFSDSFKLYIYLYILFGAKWLDYSKRYVAKDVAYCRIRSHCSRRGARHGHEVRVCGLPPEGRRWPCRFGLVRHEKQ
jgi:hypothetical protein